MSAGDVHRALWRHRVLIVFGTVVVGVAAWYGLSKITPTYRASTLVRVQQPDPGNPVASLQASQELARTYTVVIGSGGLDGRIRSVLAKAGTIAPSSGLDVSASSEKGLGLLWISAQAASPEVAARVANAAPAALAEFVGASGTSDRITTVRQASVPSSPVSPRKVVDMLIAVGVGLVLTSLLAILLEVFADRLPAVDDLEASVGYPVLGTIPTLDLVALNPANRPIRPGEHGAPVEYERKGSIEYVHGGSIEYEDELYEDGSSGGDPPESASAEESHVG